MCGKIERVETVFEHRPDPIQNHLRGDVSSMATTNISQPDYSPLLWPYSIPEGDLVLHLTFEGRPLGKQRPRFTRKGHVYTPGATREYESKLRVLMRSQLGARKPDGEHKFALRCLFYRQNRQRIDCDNLLKAVSDAATGFIWEDDSQVMEVIGRLFLASDRPRAEIVIYLIPDPSPRAKCPTCEREVVTYPSQGTTHCSMKCRNAALRATLKCKQCDAAYELPQSQARKGKGFCSRACSSRFYGARKTNYKGRSTWKCEVCSGAVSRKEYKVCRACSMKTRSDPTSNYWKLRNAKAAA